VFFVFSGLLFRSLLFFFFFFSSQRQFSPVIVDHWIIQCDVHGRGLTVPGRVFDPMLSVFSALDVYVILLIL